MTPGWGRWASLCTPRGTSCSARETTSGQDLRTDLPTPLHLPHFRLFGSTGYCAACKKIIPAFEMVMRARTNVYHLECFACQECGHRFCVGDQFFLYDNKVLCGADYEERMVFASLSSNPAQLAAIKHQDNNRFYNNNNIISPPGQQQLLKHHSQPLPPISSVRSASAFLPEKT